MNKEYLIVPFDDDAYPGWRGSVDAGIGIIFKDSRINAKHKFIAMGTKTNNLAEAIRLASAYTNKKELIKC